MKILPRLVTRAIPLVADNFGWAVQANPYPLPNGLPHRTLVRIVRNEVGDTQIHVVDPQGNEWSLNRNCVLPRLRYYYRRDELYYSEGSDRAQTLVWEEIDHRVKELEMLKKSIEELYWVVRRSGNAKSIRRLDEWLADHDPIGDYNPPDYDPNRNPCL